jgi:hypothetical protein
LQREGWLTDYYSWADIDGDGKADYLSINIGGSGAVNWWQNDGGPDDGPNAAKISLTNKVCSIDPIPRFSGDGRR